MSLHLAASLSYDVVILAFTGYFTAVCLDLAYKAETVKVGDVITIRFGQKSLSVEVVSVADNVGKADAAAQA